MQSRPVFSILAANVPEYVFYQVFAAAWVKRLHEFNRIPGWSRELPFAVIERALTQGDGPHPVEYQGAAFEMARVKRTAIKNDGLALKGLLFGDHVCLRGSG